jgi:hypothetical protein
MSRIALISEHASPLAALGGVDSGGQNVYLAIVSRVKDHFTWRHVARAVDGLYSRVLERDRYRSKPARKAGRIAIGARDGLAHPNEVLTTHHGIPTSCVPG